MILDSFNLTGKIAIVTGCNTGLGQGIAIGLAQAGADIVGVYRSDTSETQELIEDLGKGFLPVKADL
ncbi:MAG: SDR family NAD(P)-dependent oxidoreductase, partial [Clostridiales bacterium]|nr:SDR family NAD(P)-dependent oxidoreductase [Clostridiales bacterium]